MAKLQELTEESLSRPLEEVFDIICKLGKCNCARLLNGAKDDDSCGH